MFDQISRKRAWIIAGILALAAQQFIGPDIPRMILIGAVGIWFVVGDGVVIARKALSNLTNLLDGII
jgi:hypothetical protein